MPQNDVPALLAAMERHGLRGGFEGVEQLGLLLLLRHLDGQEAVGGAGVPVPPWRALAALAPEELGRRLRGEVFPSLAKAEIPHDSPARELLHRPPAFALPAPVLSKAVAWVDQLGPSVRKPAVFVEILRQHLSPALGVGLCRSCGRLAPHGTCEEGCVLVPVHDVRQFESARLGVYRLDRRIGKGGQGGVFMARDTALRATVAVKVLHPPDTDGDYRQLRNARLKFAREARVLARLRHTGIPRVHLLQDKGPIPYFAMDYVLGVMLHRMVVQSWHETLEIVRQIVDVVRYAHEFKDPETGMSLPVYHRDLKPANVLVEEGVVKVLDFGLARGGGTDTHTQTVTGAGSLGYAAPEQWVDMRRVDARADLFSVGAIAYRLLAGRPPWHKKYEHHPPAMRPLAFLQDPDPVEPLVGIPDQVADLLYALLSRDREQRPASAAEVAARLERLLGGGAAPGGVAAPSGPQGSQDLQTVVLAGKLDLDDTLQILVELAEGLQWRHSAGNAHGWLEPRAVRLSATLDVSVAELELPPDQMSPFHAPESTRADYVPTPSADVFGLGMVSLFVLSGAPLPRWAGREPERLIHTLEAPGSG